MASVGDFLDAFGFENMLLFATFLISFSLIFFVLRRVFKKKYEEPATATPGIVAFAISMIIVYGVHAMQFDLGDMLFDLGVGEDMLYAIIFLAILAALGYLIYKVGIGVILMIVGALLVTLAFTDIIVEFTVVVVTGIVLIIIGAFLFRRRLKKKTVI
jgi:hypothetical protein